MKTILLSTHNKKIKRYKDFFSEIVNLNLVTLEGLGIAFKVDEPYNTSKENSAYKARKYANFSKLSTIAHVKTLVI